MTESLEPVILTIFGITGDLAKRKVLPAIYHLFKDGLLPEKTIIVGTSRRTMTSDELLSQVEICVLETDKVCDPEVLQRLKQNLRMVQMEPTNAADYQKLHETLDAIETEQGTCMHRLFYLSIPPQVYAPVIRLLGEQGLNKGCQHGTADSRLLVEKPFGYDLVSAQELITLTNNAFSEDQVFRIDHYLAKETAQNILTFRADNPLFNELWNSQHISTIEVRALEQIGIEGRADFYEHVGALRDLVQSHLLQLLSLTTMELPAEDFDSQQVHANKQQLLDSIAPVPADKVASRVVRGQYDSYRTEVGNADSETETFVSLLLTSQHQRWEGTTFQLTTGKALAEKRTEIIVTFGQGTKMNSLTFRNQPDEGITVTVSVKKPGFSNQVEATSLDFTYQTQLADTNHPDAYERVLVDAIRGDHTLFATNQEVLSAWRILQPILDAWQRGEGPLSSYRTGSTGPDISKLMR